MNLKWILLVLVACLVLFLVAWFSSSGSGGSSNEPQAGRDDVRRAATKTAPSLHSSSSNSYRVPNSLDDSLCILPVGDSLTQGVAQHSGYRAFLNRSVEVVTTAKRTLHRLVSVGTVAGTCVIGKPAQIWKPPSSAMEFHDELHEGHCSWGARLLRERIDNDGVLFSKHLKPKSASASSSSSSSSVEAAMRLKRSTRTLVQITADQRKQLGLKRMNAVKPCIVRQRRTQRENQADEDGGQDINDLSHRTASTFLRIDVALLMIGHNNAFQAAAFCKLKESNKPISDQLRLWLKVFEGYDTPTEKALLPSISAKQQCAWKFLRTEFAPHLTAMVELLLGDDVKGTTRVVVGLNPPTGFSVLDAFLHAVIKMVVSHKQRQLQSTDRIQTASFPKFGASTTATKHTFDSTHPNDAGAMVIAEGWDVALRSVVAGLEFD